MGEIVRTNDIAAISAIEGLLIAAEIPYHVADRNVSVLEGSIGVWQRRVLVPDEHELAARELLAEADFGEWLR
ncbi:MAG: DUF2007 domain-containing protein [Nocardioidaceae bacterium]|nr:MAG: DUF2007 domain-containing protein [Nocardioidaceae bacterium]